MRFPTVSVVIPVHNAMPYLEKTIDSVLSQTIGTDRIEIIAVDDGSTDGSGDFLDKLAHHHGDLITVVHQAASGGPGHPRNVALDYFATGEYVFFLDADDHLGPEALERLVASARRNGSDVVLGKVVGVDRSAPQSMFRRNEDAADLYTSRIYWSIAAWKLFRTDHLRRHGIRFPVGVKRAEDQPFTFHAYLRARNISIVADYDCLYLVRRDDGGNVTSATGEDFLQRTAILWEMLVHMVELLHEHVPPGPGRDHLMYRHWETEGISLLRFIAMIDDPEARTEWWQRTTELLHRHLTAGSLAKLHPHNQPILLAAAATEFTEIEGHYRGAADHGRVKELTVIDGALHERYLAIADRGAPTTFLLDKPSRMSTTVTGIARRNGRLHISGTTGFARHRVLGLHPRMVAIARETGATLTKPAEYDPDTQHFNIEIDPIEDFHDLAQDDVFDLYVEFELPGQTLQQALRVPNPAELSRRRTMLTRYRLRTSVSVHQYLTNPRKRVALEVHKTKSTHNLVRQAKRAIRRGLHRPT